MSNVLNDWVKEEIIHKSKILHFDVLTSKNLLKNVEGTDYWTIDQPIENVEYEIYKYLNDKLVDKLNIEDYQVEIKKFIKDLHLYNELKDIGQSLVNKIAERKNTTSKKIIKEMGYDFE